MSPVEPAVRLTPPLRLAWSWAEGYGVGPTLAEGMALVQSRRGAVEALREGTGEVVWSFRPAGRGGSAAPGLVVNDSLLATLGPKERYGLLRLQNGRVIKEISWPHQGRMKYAEGLIFCDGTSDLCARRPWEMEAVWRISLGQEPTQWMAGQFALAPRRLVYGIKEGPVVCLDTWTGSDVWRTSIADLTSVGHNSIERAGEVSGPISVHEDVVIVTSFPRHVVGLSLTSGRRLWTYVGDNGMAQLYRGRYYVSAGWLDCQTGRLTKRGKLQWPDELQRKGVYTRGGWLISDTHLFVGTTHGYLVALERDSGKCAWYERPGGAVGQIQSEGLISANGRLYYVDQSRRLFCLEEENPTDPVLMKQGVEAKAARPGAGVIVPEVLDASRAKVPSRPLVATKNGPSKRAVRVAPRRAVATKRPRSAAPARRKKA